MAAKSLEQALLYSGIENEIKKALCIGPLHEIVARVNKAEENIVENIQYQVRDYIAHRAMILGEDATALDLFNDICGNIPPHKETKQ